jgi:hypothetical protein
MAAYNPNGRTTLHTSRGHSIISDSPFTPRATPQPTRRAGVATRGVRTETVDSELVGSVNSSVRAVTLPAHYKLRPTVPSPFVGTLEASLDAILNFGLSHARCQGVVNAMLEKVTPTTNWPLLLRGVYLGPNSMQKGRMLHEEILFLVTRTLLPEQIAESRSLMSRLYERKKQLAIRLILRYDMLREWKTDHLSHPITVASLPPPTTPAPSADIDISGLHLDQRRPLRSNIISTLVAAPLGGWTTHAVRERMKHHVTDLDSYLLLTDEYVAGWDDQILLSMTSQIILQWQWLRQNNEILIEMEIMGYEELEGRANENDWIVDDVKRRGRAREGEKEKEREDDEEFGSKRGEK